MGTRNLRIATVIAFLFVAAACDEQKGPPTAPTPPPVTSLTISGSTSISDPGGTTRLTATARYSDDTTRDVTAEAQWRSSHNDPFTDVLDVISPGLIRARSYGKGGVRATYSSGLGSVWADADVRVAPNGIFLAAVAVSDHGHVTNGALVQVTSAAGTFSATTDLRGVVDLPAAGDAVFRVEKAGFCTITESVTVSRDQRFDFVLQPCDGTSSTVTR